MLLRGSADDNQTCISASKNEQPQLNSQMAWIRQAEHVTQLNKTLTMPYRPVSRHDSHWMVEVNSARSVPNSSIPAIGAQFSPTAQQRSNNHSIASPSSQPFFRSTPSRQRSQPITLAITDDVIMSAFSLWNIWLNSHLSSLIDTLVSISEMTSKISILIVTIIVILNIKT